MPFRSLTLKSVCFTAFFALYFVLFFTLFFAIFFTILIPAYAEIETMTVSELSPGMRGVGRTVIKGTEISEFNVEIIDVFAKMGWNGGPLILCRLSGPVVEATGGIAGGFSGSPVFIDGKLIGALSAGWAYTDGMVAAATPINEMLKAWLQGLGPRVDLDHVSLRRALVDDGFVERTPDGASYARSRAHERHVVFRSEEGVQP
jgi:hypothetical protein